MAAAFKAKGTFASGSGAVSPGIPSGMAAGDFMLLFVHSANQAASAPSGWTAIPTVSGSPFRGTAGAAGGVRLDIFYRWWQSGDSAPSVADTGDVTAAIICGYSGVDATTPFDGATPIASNAAASTTLTLPGITTQTNNALVVQAAALDRDSASTTTVSGPHANSNLTGEAERHDQTVSTNSGGGLWIGDGLMATAGATGNSTATQTSNAFACITVSLRAGPTVGPQLRSYSLAQDTAVVPKPDGAVEGDLVVIHAFVVARTIADITDPSGFTRLADDLDLFGDAIVITSKILGPSEGSSFTFTVAGGLDEFTQIYAFCWEEGTFDPADPFGADLQYNTGTNATRTALGVTTDTDDAVLVVASWGTESSSTSTPAGMIEMAGDGIRVHYRETIAASGATGNRTHTQGGSSNFAAHSYSINALADDGPAPSPRFHAFAFG